jgi:L-fuculose-phosphate aldolase
MSGLATGVRASLGHVSMRLPSNPRQFVVKGRGYAMDVLMEMRPRDMVLCDIEGYLLDGPPGVVQCNEVKIHSCIYKARPDVHSIVHVHPTYCVLMSVLGSPLVPMAVEGIRMVWPSPPVYPHAGLVTTEEQGQDLAATLGNGPSVLLQGHGAVTVGKDLEASVVGMMHLEHQAQMNYLAFTASGPDHPGIPAPLVQEYLDWKPLAEPHFQAAIAKVGAINPMASIWTYLTDQAARTLREPTLTRA